MKKKEYSVVLIHGDPASLATLEAKKYEILMCCPVHYKQDASKGCVDQSCGQKVAEST